MGEIKHISEIKAPAGVGGDVGLVSRTIGKDDGEVHSAQRGEAGSVEQQGLSLNNGGTCGRDVHHPGAHCETGAGIKIAVIELPSVC